MKNQINYSFIHSLIILFVVMVCLYNLTIQQTDGQMWEKLLLFSFGLIIPTPNNSHNNNNNKVNHELETTNRNGK
jgi:hypothetical protein